MQIVVANATNAPSSTCRMVIIASRIDESFTVASYVRMVNASTLKVKLRTWPWCWAASSAIHDEEDAMPRWSQQAAGVSVQGPASSFDGSFHLTALTRRVLLSFGAGHYRGPDSAG